MANVLELEAKGRGCIELFLLLQLTKVSGFKKKSLFHTSLLNTHYISWMRRFWAPGTKQWPDPSPCPQVAHILEGTMVVILWRSLCHSEAQLRSSLGVCGNREGTKPAWGDRKMLQEVTSENELELHKWSCVVLGNLIPLSLSKCYQ